MKRAIISDIHGNLEALSAVLCDIVDQGIERVCCLGDMVGYGPNPCECVEALASAEFCLMGNHEEALFAEPDDLTAAAAEALNWTRAQFAGSSSVLPEDFPNDLPRFHNDGRLLFVHGSPIDPTHDYVLRMDVHDPDRMLRLFSKVDHLCFIGHTHVPGVLMAGQFLSPSEFDLVSRVDTHKALVNVGSVGQPRDGNPDACYVVLTEDHIAFRRVEYDIEKTIGKIHAIPSLDDEYGDRLRLGR